MAHFRSVRPRLEANPLALLQHSLLNDLYRREVVMASLIQEGTSLEFAVTELQDDLDMVLLAVVNDGLALQFTSDKMRRNLDVAFTAVSQDGGALEFVSPELRSDKELVMNAVMSNQEEQGSALMFASPALRCDPEICFAAVTKYGMALEHLPRVAPSPSWPWGSVAWRSSLRRAAFRTTRTSS